MLNMSSAFKELPHLQVTGELTAHCWGMANTAAFEGLWLRVYVKRVHCYNVTSAEIIEAHCYIVITSKLILMSIYVLYVYKFL